MVIIIEQGCDNPLSRIEQKLDALLVNAENDRKFQEWAKEALSKMATQQEIDDLTAIVVQGKADTITAITDSKTALTTTVESEHQEVMDAFAAWEASHPNVDISALKDAVSGFKDNVTAAVADETSGLTTGVQGIFTAPTPTPTPGVP